MEPIYKALTEGLGEAGFQDFAERISGLGSGDLTPAGYQGGACLKFTCDADWAVLVLDRASEQAFAIWNVEGDTVPQVWPKDTSTWPEAPLAALREAVGG